MANYVIHFDGSCWPNPGGVAAYGYTIDKDGVEIAAVPGIVPELGGVTSNNVAEFYALYEALEAIPSVTSDDTIDVFGDSQIVINIMNRKWKSSVDKLYFGAYCMAAERRDYLEFARGVNLSFKWIPREDNTRCDDLSKEINNAPK